VDLTELFLSGITDYGPLVLGLATLLAAAGLPTPATPLVLAAGAFARQGLLDWRGALILALIGVVVGDVTSYGIGRFAGNWVDKISSGGRRAALIQKARDRFNRNGGLALYLTHFIFTSLDVPSNLVAGSTRYPFPRFLFFVLSGRGSWILLYGTLGYLVGSQWAQINTLLNRYTLWVGLLIALTIGAFYFWRRSNIDLRSRLANR
jgi:membrane protein DedA with SNARE-associated domain